MTLKRQGVNHVWFNDRVREALRVAEQGRHDTAVDLLERLASRCHQAANDGLSEWYEIQALGLLGVEFERRGAHAKAAAAYRRVADLRRAALQEAGHGLASALAAAAVASLRAGERPIARTLAAEALGLHKAYPLPKHDLDFLRRHVRGRRSTPKSKKPRSRRHGGFSR